MSDRHLAAGPLFPTTVRVDWRFAVGVTAGLSLLFGLQNYLAPTVRRGSDSFVVSLGQQVVTWATWLLLSPLVFWAARRWRAGRSISASTFLTQGVMCVVVSLLHSLVAGTCRWLLNWSPSHEWTDVMSNAVVSNLAANVLRYVMISVAYHAVAYHLDSLDRGVRAARLEASLAQARLDSLQGRLHPHFLFNTLNSIAALVREEPAAAERMIGSLGDLLRAAVDAEPSREVTLERELELVREYVSIQQMRFADRLAVAFDAPPELLACYVPHMVLQPLVENAIRHGIAPHDGTGTVRVGADRSGDRLRLTVEDDGVGPPSLKGSSTGGGFGLTGTRARLKHLYGHGATLELCHRTPAGVIATIELPFHVTPTAAPTA
jgi:two-component system LytT family sensor kinase